MAENETGTLTTDNYTIEMSSKGFDIFTVDAVAGKQWIASAGDPQVAMRIVEGLLMVDTKRFYYPESGPKVEAVAGKPEIPFLNTLAEKP